MRLSTIVGWGSTCALLLGVAGIVRADGPVPSGPPGQAPSASGTRTLATDEQAAEAIRVFKEAWKAKGLKGDERTSQRDFALSELSKVQHPTVVAELAEVSRSGDDTLRTLAVIYLGDEKACPGLAGKHVIAAVEKNGKDTAFVLSALDSVASLRYLSGGETLRNLMNGQNYIVQKAAVTTVGKVKDMRLLGDLLALLGIDASKGAEGPKDESSGGKEVVEEGYSWEGAEATHDTGTAGDGDQKEAERKAKEQMAANKAKADAAHGGGGGGGMSSGGSDSGGVGGAGGRGGAARSKEEIKGYVLKALRSLTGETFMSSKDIRVWLAANVETIAAAKKACAEAESEQKAAAK